MVKEESKNIPITSEVDVAVVGVGSAGTMAAVGASRAGARTCGIERCGSVGGAWNMGLIGHFGNYFRSRNGEDLVGGAPREMLERVLLLGAHPYRDVEDALGHLSIFFRHELCGRVCMEMLQESNVELWLQTRFCAAQPAPNQGYDLIVETKGGRLAIRAREVVDCSGEADVALAVGAPMRIAKDRSWGLLFEMGHVDLQRYEAFLGDRSSDCPGWDAWLARTLGMSEEELRADRYWGDWVDGGKRAWPFRPEIMEAVDAGDLYLMKDLAGGGRIRYGWDGFWPEAWHGEDVVTANVCMLTELSPHDARDVSKAETAARDYAFRFVNFLRKYIPGFENAHIRIMGAQTMPRGGAEIIGERPVTLEEIHRGAIPEDSVCLAGHHGFGLPLGQFVPKGVDHLLVAGKCAANGYSIRGSITCGAGGYSCGILAALAAREGVTPMALDPGARREALLKHGVRLSRGPARPDMTDYIMPQRPGVPYWDRTGGAERSKKLS